MADEAVILERAVVVSAIPKVVDALSVDIVVCKLSAIPCAVSKKVFTVPMQLSRSKRTGVLYHSIRSSQLPIAVEQAIHKITRVTRGNTAHIWASKCLGPELSTPPMPLMILPFSTICDLSF